MKNAYLFDFDGTLVDSMPTFVSAMLRILDENGTLAGWSDRRVIKQFKGSITKQVGRPIWQKSFYDHGIRNQQDYDEIREYIENNPLKYALNRTPSWCPVFAGERSSPLR